MQPKEADPERYRQRDKHFFNLLKTKIMQNVTLSTTLGDANFKVSDKATKIVSCGISFNILRCQVFTSEDERSGYIVEYHLLTHKKTLKRIKVSYISSESIKKYGRKCVSEILPIFKSN